MTEIATGFGKVCDVFAGFEDRHRQFVCDLVQLVDVELVALGEFSQVPSYLAKRDSGRNNENVRAVTEHTRCRSPGDRGEQDVSVRGYAFYARRSHAQFLLR